MTLDDCTGIYLANEVNGIVISRCTIEDNINPGVGIIVLEGEDVAIENCGIEGNGGPAIIAASIRALSIKGNYIEDPNQHPITMTSYADATKRNFTITAAIVLNGGFVSSHAYVLRQYLHSRIYDRRVARSPTLAGAYPPLGDPVKNIWHGYESSGVVIEANFFSLSHMNGSAVLLASADNVVLAANYNGGAMSEHPYAQMAVASTSSDPAIFYAKVKASLS